LNFRPKEKEMLSLSFFIVTGMDGMPLSMKKGPGNIQLVKGETIIMAGKQIV